MAIERKTVTLEPDESTEVAFTFTPDEIKIYHVRVDGLHKTFQCLAPTRAHGRVNDEAAKINIVGVLVEIVGTTLSDITDAGGNFHIDNTPFGVCTFRFTHPDYVTKTITVDLIRGLNNPLGIIYLIPIVELGSITGKLMELDVATGDTTPMPYVAVTVNGYITTSDGEGFFTVSDLPLGPYDTLTVPGYIPYPLNLDVIGHHDLGVVEMIPVGAEYVIHLGSLSFEPVSVAVGQTIIISCQAVLYIAPLNEPVTRTVTLTINGVVIETRDITLTRTSEYWPATERIYFEFTPEAAGSYHAELDGSVGDFEVTPPINYIEFTGIVKVADFLEITAANLALYAGDPFWEAYYAPALRQIANPDSCQLLNVRDIGFDGINAWYNVEINAKCCFWLYMVIIPEADYAIFVSDTSNPDRCCTGPTLCSISNEDIVPGGSPPQGKWRYWKALYPEYPHRQLIPVGISELSMIGPLDEGKCWACRPREYPPVEPPPGNYKVVLAVEYTNRPDWWEYTRRANWCTVWEVGRMSL